MSPINHKNSLPIYLTKTTEAGTPHLYTLSTYLAHPIRYTVTHRTRRESDVNMSREKAIQSKARAAAEDHLQELRVDSLKSSRRHSDSPVADKKRVPKTSSRSTDYVYVNRAYTGSTNDVESVREEPVPAPVTR